jgi:glucose/arabinose dehydrogenase
MRFLLAIVLSLALPLVGAASAGAAGVRLQSVGHFDQPVYLTSPPGARATQVVVERYGLVRAIRNGRVSRTPFLDLRSRVLVADRRETVDQRGLFSLAFAPDYGRSGRFYVDYVDRAGRMRVDEFRRGHRGGRRVLDLGPVSTQHHGGQLGFGPDGLLYVSTGMNDDPSTSQDLARPGGKILRLDPRARGARPEIYALGLRNPWRFSFDRASGTLLIGDVGDESAEEVDLVPPRAPAGANFGWPAYEGLARRADAPDVPGARPPAVAFPHADGRCAVTGGYVVRDRGLPALAGRYLYGDLCTGRLRSARLQGDALVDDQPLDLNGGYIVSFGEDAQGRVYTVAFDGAVSRILPAP